MDKWISYNKSVWTWFDIFWPWFGLLVSILMVILLFGTHLFRQDLRISRWRDSVWLSWLVIPIYMLHEFEEYGIDFLGTRHAFPEGLCNALRLENYPQCPIPHTFYLFVNIPLVWVFAPVAASFCRKNQLVGLGLYSVVITNGIVHLLTFVLMGRYNPGVFTSFVIFLPSFFWVCKACFGDRGLPRSGISIIVMTGIILHAILISSLLLFVNHRISGNLLNFIQIINASQIIIIPWLGSRLIQ